MLFFSNYFKQDADIGHLSSAEIALVGTTIAIMHLLIAKKMNLIPEHLNHFSLDATPALASHIGTVCVGACIAAQSVRTTDDTCAESTSSYVNELLWCMFGAALGTTLFSTALLANKLLNVHAHQVQPDLMPLGPRLQLR